MPRCARRRCRCDTTPALRRSTALISRPQERAEIEERLAGAPDVVPRWHRAQTIIGAGAAGFVYEVRPLTPAPAPRRRRRPTRSAVASGQALNDVTGELLAVKLVAVAGPDRAAAGLRRAVSLRHPNLVRSPHPPSILRFFFSLA